MAKISTTSQAPDLPRDDDVKVKRKRVTVFTQRRLWGFVFVLPAFVFFAVFAFYPMINALWISFTDYNLVTTPHFIGLQNYARMLTDARFKIMAGNTVGFVLGSTIPTILLSLGLALVLQRKFLGRDLIRTLYFLPVILSGVVVSVVWRLLYHPYGLVNVLLGPILQDAPRWITSRDLAPWALIILNVWQAIGFYMVIFIAGLQNIPDDFYDAAKVDGANPPQAFWYITLPLLKPTSLLVLVISIINYFQTFTYQYVMTKGGPSDATNVISLYIYLNAFQYQYMGYAAAISIIMFLFIMVLTLIQFRVIRTEDTSFV
jgi:multiple sugar transport system permease protein